ncbi:MAG: YciI family protein [Actinomycetota bacterium]
MKYMLLIYGDEQAAAKATPAEMQATADAYEVFTQSIRKTGNFLDGDPFHGTNESTTVQVRGGKTTTTAGPVEQTGQQLLAYYKVEAKDEGQAIEMASRIPGALYGTIEVRPVMQFD